MKEMENRKSVRMAVMGALLLPVVIIGLISLTVLQLITKGALVMFSGMIIIFVITACALCVMFVLAKRVSDRVLEFTENLDQAAEQKLAMKEQKISEQERELGEILRSMNCMAGNIAPVITGVKHASVSLREISEEFTKSFQEMTSSMEQMDGEVGNTGDDIIARTEEIQGLGTQIAEIHRIVDMISNHAEELEKSTDKIKECSENAVHSIEELVQISETGSQAMADMQLQAEEVNESAAQVRAAGEMLAGISSQANLAALNASIEVARAGKLGRNFVSVSDEMRVFADQSREVSEKINGIADALQDSVKLKEEGRQKASETYEKQAEKISGMKEMVTSINQEAEQMGDVVCRIADQASKLKSSDEIFDTDIVTLPEPVQEKATAGEQVDHIGSFKITDFRK